MVRTWSAEFGLLGLVNGRRTIRHRPSSGLACVATFAPLTNHLALGLDSHSWTSRGLLIQLLRWILTFVTACVNDFDENATSDVDVVRVTRVRVRVTCCVRFLRDPQSQRHTRFQDLSWGCSHPFTIFHSPSTDLRPKTASCEAEPLRPEGS